MYGLKLMWKRWVAHRGFFAATLVLFAGMMIAVMFFHESPGNYESEDGDYLMCKVCALLPMIFGILIPGMATSSELNGNRFIRAIPCAAKMYTVGFPLFGVMLSLCWGLGTNLVYGLFILFSGGDICNISDMLLLTAPFALLGAVSPVFVYGSSIGAAFGLILYFPFLLIMVGISRLPETVRYSGFGLPVWVSALILAGAYLLGSLLGLAAAAALYRRGNFKEPTYYGGVYRK